MVFIFESNHPRASCAATVRRRYQKPSPALLTTPLSFGRKGCTTIMTSSTFLQCALADSLSSGIFIDTKIYGFTRRKPNDHVGDARPLYVNSHVLRQVPHFDIRKYKFYIVRSLLSQVSSLRRIFGRYHDQPQSGR